jgi:DtxR family Mn-dependent transcriptional regulator
MKLSRTVEDYLGIIFILERDGEVVHGVRLAELLGVTPPTVTNTLKRMARDGLLALDSSSGAQLSERGREAARSVMRRHMLTEWMVTRLIPWSKTHAEAHDLEHAISAEVEAALQSELNQPELCPHGNPLPGHELAVSGWLALADLPAGERVVIRRIHELAEEVPGLLDFLEERGLLPGQMARITQRLDFNQTIELEVDGRVTTLGFTTARKIYVERLGV